jgi:type I restriction enzyme S subunit
MIHPSIPSPHLLNRLRIIGAYLDSVETRLASRKGMISLRELQSQTEEELDALLPSVLDRAFKGEL